METPSPAQDEGGSISWCHLPSPIAPGGLPASLRGDNGPLHRPPYRRGASRRLRRRPACLSRPPGWKASAFRPARTCRRLSARAPDAQPRAGLWGL